MKTICIAGKNDIAVNILLYCIKFYYKCRIVCVVNMNEPGINTWQKSLKWFAEKNGVEILSLKDVYEIEDLLFLSLEFDRIIRPEKFKSTLLYNIHFSMLPKYKGMHTSVLPILYCEENTGVTLHRIREGIDTGEIVEQTVVPISEDDSSFDLYKKLICSGTELVINNFCRLLHSNLETYQQPQQGSTYFSYNTIDYSNIKLDVNKTAYQIQNQVRAFYFRVFQIITWNGVKYLECKITNEVSNSKPGTIIEDTDIFTKISTIDYNAILYKDVFEELLESIRSGDNERSQYLCASKKTFQSQDYHGWSALTVAVYNNNFQMVDFLCKRGADINVLNNNGTTLLMYAKNCYTLFEDATIFEYLMEWGLNPNQKDYYGKELADYCRDEGIESIGNYRYTLEAGEEENSKYMWYRITSE